jgi:hypothetical protein
MTRKEANRGAWEKMLETYPPFDADDEAAHWLSACDFPPAEVSTVEAGEPSLADLWYALCVLSAYRAYETSSEGLQLVAASEEQFGTGAFLAVTVDCQCRAVSWGSCRGTLGKDREA